MALPSFAKITKTTPDMSPRVQPSAGKANVAQFGQKIKAKYPEYADIPDEELGQKMITKYPEYRDMIDKPLPEPVQQKPVETNKAEVGAGVGAGVLAGAGVLGGAKIAGEALKRAGKTVYGLTLPPNIAEAGKIQAYEAGLTSSAPKTMVSTALEQPLLQKGGRTLASKIGLMGTRAQIGTQALSRAKEVGKTKIEPFFQKAAELGKTASYDALKNEAISKISASSLYSGPRKQEIIDEIAGLFEGLAGETDLKNIDLQAREIRNKLPQKYMQGVMPTEALKDAQKVVSSTMKDAVYKTAKEMGDDVAKAYLDYGNLKGMAEVGKKAMTQAGRKGGTGTLLSWVVDELATPLTTAAGKTAYKAGSALSAVPTAIYNKIKKAPKNIKALIKGGGLAPVVTSAILGDKIPGAYAQKALETYINYDSGQGKFKELKGGPFKAVSEADYNDYKDKEGNIIFPDGSKYNKDGVYIGKIL